MSEKKSKAVVKSTEELAAARLEALEPDEGRIGGPAEEVRFIFLPPWTGDDYEKPPRVIKHPDGFTLVIHGREIPEEYAEEYLRQHPGARLEEAEGSGE